MNLHEAFAYRDGLRRPPGIRDGADIERAVFGVPTEESSGEYLPFSEAVAWVKQYQPSPLERSKIVNTLRKQVAALSSNTSEPVKFYTAVNTPLDIYHGVDAFIEQGGRRVTIDISMREKDTYKADVVLEASFDDDGRPVVSQNEIDRVARFIATQLSQPMRRAA